MSVNDRLLARISQNIGARAGDLNRGELERFSRRAEAARQIQEILDDLKSRIARKAALRQASDSTIAECPSQAA